MSFFDNKRLLKIFVPVFWVSALILAAVSIFLTLRILINILPAEQTDNDRRTYHIVAAGTRSCSYSLARFWKEPYPFKMNLTALWKNIRALMNFQN